MFNLDLIYPVLGLLVVVTLIYMFFVFLLKTRSDPPNIFFRRSY